MALQSLLEHWTCHLLGSFLLCTNNPGLWRRRTYLATPPQYKRSCTRCCTGSGAAHVKQWIVSRKTEYTNTSCRLGLAKHKVPGLIRIKINHCNPYNTECSLWPLWLKVFVHIRDVKLEMSTVNTSFTFKFPHGNWRWKDHLETWKYSKVLHQGKKKQSVWFNWRVSCKTLKCSEVK